MNGYSVANLFYFVRFIPGKLVIGIKRHGRSQLMRLEHPKPDIIDRFTIDTGLNQTKAVLVVMVSNGSLMLDAVDWP